MPNPATFQLKLKGFKEMQRALKDYPNTAKPIVKTFLRETEAIFAKHTLKDDPVPYRTGNLLQSFRHKSDDFRAWWFPTANYAAHVEFGTKPHVIRPRTKQALSWKQGRTSGRYVTSKSGRRYYKQGSPGVKVAYKKVNHPGTKPQPYMEKILQKSKPEVEKHFERAFDLIHQGIAKQISPAPLVK